jgi:hypothetical protein
MLIAFSLLVLAFAGGGLEGSGGNLTRGAILEAVATEGVRASLSPWWKGAPWPDGAVIAQLQARLPEVNTLMVHALLGALAFSCIGFCAGRMLFSNGVLLLPPMLFFATYGFLRSDVFTLTPFNPVSVAIVIFAQLACVYGFALWGKWSIRG